MENSMQDKAILSKLIEPTFEIFYAQVSSDNAVFAPDGAISAAAM